MKDSSVLLAAVMQSSLVEMAETVLADQCVCWLRSRGGVCSNSCKVFQTIVANNFRLAHNSIVFFDLVLT